MCMLNHLMSEKNKTHTPSPPLAPAPCPHTQIVGQSTFNGVFTLFFNTFLPFVPPFPSKQKIFLAHNPSHPNNWIAHSSPSLSPPKA